VDGLEHARTLRIEVGARRQTEASLDHGSQVGDYVSEHIGSYHHIKPLRILDKPHGYGINEVEVMLYLGIAGSHIQKDLSPEAVDVAEHIGLVHGGELTAALHGQIEGVLNHPLASFPADLSDLVADLLAVGFDIQAEFDVVEAAADLKVGVAASPTGPASNSDVEVLCVLAHDHKVDVLGALVLERCPDPLQQLHRPQVDILVEVKAHGQEDSFLQNARADPGIADSSQEECPVFRQLLQRLLSDQLSCLQVVLRSQRVLLPVQGEVVFFCRRLQDLAALSYNLRAYAVSGDDRYCVFHTFTSLTCRLVYSTRPPASTIS